MCVCVCVCVCVEGAVCVYVSAYMCERVKCICVCACACVWSEGASARDDGMKALTIGRGVGVPSNLCDHSVAHHLGSYKTKMICKTRNQNDMQDTLRNKKCTQRIQITNTNKEHNSNLGDAT